MLDFIGIYWHSLIIGISSNDLRLLFESFWMTHVCTLVCNPIAIWNWVSAFSRCNSFKLAALSTYVKLSNIIMLAKGYIINCNGTKCMYQPNLWPFIKIVNEFALCHEHLYNRLKWQQNIRKQKNAERRNESETNNFRWFKRNNKVKFYVYGVISITTQKIFPSWKPVVWAFLSVLLFCVRCWAHFN